MTREDAIEKVRQMSLPKEMMEILEALAPELREDEDERIREYIINVVNLEKGVNIPPDDADRMLAYLEKQKVIAAIPDELVECYKNLCERGNREVALLINAINGINEQNEQKPAEWSDEDEYALLQLTSIVQGYEKMQKNPGVDCIMWSTDRQLPEKLFRFLKSLKPQAKQEWSEEDEHRRKDAIYFLESAKKHYADTSEIEKTIAWLKSLRPSWRPSEEQIMKDAVEGTVHHVLNAHYIEINQKQLNVRLRDFPEGTNVKIFIVKSEEESK